MNKFRKIERETSDITKALQGMTEYLKILH